MLFGGYFGTARSRCCRRNDVLARARRGNSRVAGRSCVGADRAALFGSRAGCSSRHGCSSSRSPRWADAAERSSSGCIRILINKYGFDWFNEHVIAPFARRLGTAFWKGGDELLIDGALVNGSARIVGWLGSVMRYAQSGYLYHYAFAMILGLASLLLWLIWRPMI